MYAFEISESQIKKFMNQLLRENTFDEFEVRGVEINSFTKFEISGAKEPTEELAKENQNKCYCSWVELKPYVFNIIKGGKKPSAMKFIFSLPPEKVKLMHPKAAAYFLNVTFNGSVCICTTASSEKEFTMDKTIDFVWEEYIQAFMSNNNIAVSTL